MKTLKFKDNLVPLVLSREKDFTWRLFDDKDLKEGDDILLINKDNGKEFGKATIIFTEEKKLEDLDEQDFKKYGKSKTKEETLQVFRGYYGDRVKLDSIVKMVKFKLLE